jgi:hypothetical protein
VSKWHFLYATRFFNYLTGATTFRMTITEHHVTLINVTLINVVGALNIYTICHSLGDIFVLFTFKLIGIQLDDTQYKLISCHSTKCHSAECLGTLYTYTVKNYVWVTFLFVTRGLFTFKLVEHLAWWHVTLLNVAPLNVVVPFHLWSITLCMDDIFYFITRGYLLLSL